MNSPAAAEIEKIAIEFRDRYFRLFPEKATFLGTHDFDGLMGKWSREGVREKITFLTHYLDLVKNSLETDALILRNIIESNLFHLKNVKPYLRPDFFVNHALSSIDRMIYLLKKAKSKQIQRELANCLVSRVCYFPILFEHSREWLKTTTHISRNQSLAKIKFFMQFMETDYRGFIYSLDIDDKSMEKLIGIIPFTIENLKRFEQFINTIEIIPLSSRSLKKSENFYKNLYAKKHFIHLNTKSVLKQTYAKLDDLDHQMGEMAGNNIHSYYNELLERNLIRYSKKGINTQLMAYYEKTSRIYFDYCRQTGLFPVKDMPLIEWTPAYKRASSPFASYIEKGPYETIIDKGRFWICPTDESMTRSRFLKNKTLLNYQLMNSVIMHELIGHHIASQAAFTMKEDLFKFSDNLAFDEGFALYAEEEFAKSYAGSLSDRIQARDILFYQKKAEYLRATRVIVDIGLGTRQMKIEEAAAFYADKNQMPLEKARQVCENYYLNPGVASSYLIGKFEILKVKQYFKEKLKESFSLNRFNREVIGYGSMPVSLIKRLMLNKHYVDEKVII